MPELRLAGVRLTWFIGAVLDAIYAMHTTAGPTKPGALTDALDTKADPKKSGSTWAYFVTQTPVSVI